MLLDWGWLLRRSAWQSPIGQDSSWGTTAGRGGHGDSKYSRTCSSRTHLSPLLLWPVFLGKLYCFGIGKGQDWHTR